MPEETRPTATCPKCASHRFRVDGLVGYRQDYDAKHDDWSASEIQWEVDYPQSAKCDKCGRDAIKLLQKAGVVAEYFDQPPPRERRKRGKKTYLVDFELSSGEYGQTFHHVFDAPDPKDLERQISRYLRDYYDGGSRREGNVWFYCEDEVAVKLHGWLEVTDPMQIVQKLKV